MNNMLTPIATDIIRDGINALRDRVIASQKAKNLRDTGASANSLVVTVLNTDKTVAGQLHGFERWRYQENGRGPNRSRKPSRQMVDDIRAWAKRHGIEQEAAYPIALKIAREGIEVPNPHNPGGVLSEVLNTETVRKELGPALRSAILKELKFQIFNRNSGPS